MYKLQHAVSHFKREWESFAPDKEKVQAGLGAIGPLTGLAVELEELESWEDAAPIQCGSKLLSLVRQLRDLAAEIQTSYKEGRDSGGGYHPGPPLSDLHFVAGLNLYRLAKDLLDEVLPQHGQQ